MDGVVCKEELQDLGGVGGPTYLIPLSTSSFSLRSAERPGELTRNVDTWKDTRDTEKRRLEVLKAPSSWPRMLRILSRKAPSQPWDLTVFIFLMMQLVSRARESFCLMCSS